MAQFVRKGKKLDPETQALADSIDPKAVAVLNDAAAAQGDLLDETIQQDGTTELAVVGKENQLEVSKVEGLLQQFGQPFLEARQLAAGYAKLVVTDENDTEGMKKARDLRLQLRQVRINAENTRKQLKEDSLREGKAIDGMANIIKAIIVPAEQHLEQQEKFAETLAAERKATRKAERTHELSQYMDNVFIFNLEEMDDDQYAQVLEDAKAKWESKQAAIKAEQEAAEQKRKDDEAAAEKKRQEQAAALKKAQADAKKLAAEKAESDAKAAAAQKAADDAQAALDAKAKQEADEAAAAEKAKQDALKAPDKDKLRSLYKQVAELSENLPEMQSDEAAQIVAHVKTVLTGSCKYIADEAKKL